MKSLGNKTYHNGLPHFVGILMLLLSPMAVNADWKALKPPGNMNVCTLETENEKMPDGYSETKVKLRLTPDALVINTNSNIDLSFNDVGLVVDNKEFIPATDVRDEKNVVFSSDIDTIIQQFIKGLRVTLHIRYWPTYPTTDNFKISFSLIGFTKAYHEYESCMANTL